MRVLALVALLAAASSVQGFSGAMFNGTAPNASFQYSFDAIPVDTLDDAIVQMVGYEQGLSKTYLDLVLKVQHAYYISTSMKYFDALIMMDMMKKMGESPPKMGMSPTKIDLLAHYNLFYATKVFLTQQVFAAAELQVDFENQRKTTYLLQMANSAGVLPQELVQFMYLQMSIMFLKVQKMSAAFRTVSTFTSWLEDELDVSIDLINSKGSKAAEHKAGLMQKDLIETRSFSFAALSDYTTLDLTIFSMEVYVQYQVQGMMAAAGAAQPVSMLEVETETETKTATGTKFYAALAAPFVLGGDTGTYLTVYTGYQKYAAYAAASAGQQSCMFSKLGFKAKDQKKSKTFRTAAKAAWAQYSQFSTQAANIDYITSMWMIYSFFVQPTSAAH